MMSSRCRNIDPGVIIYLLEEKKMSIKQVKKLLYEESGLKGVSGFNGDMAELEKSNKPQAKLAIELFCYQAAKQLARLIPALGGLDILVFTGGIGENSDLIRRKICQQFSWLGLKLSNNNSLGKISTSDSKIEVYVIAADEELVMVKQSYDLVKSTMS
jgi:acetate kinase